MHFVLTGLVLLFLFERVSSPDLNIGARKQFLVRLSWPLWLMCGLYVEELPRKGTTIEQWLLYTNWRRTQMRGLPIWLPQCSSAWSHRVLKWTATGPLGVNILASRFKEEEVRKCDLRLLSLLNHTNILFHVSLWALSKLILTFIK